MKIIKSTLAITIASILLSGCSSLGGTKMPEDIKDPFPEVYSEVVNDWEKREKPITKIKATTDFLITNINPIPKEIKDIKISNLSMYINNLSMYQKEKGELATFNDFVYFLKSYNVDIFIEDELLGEKKLKDQIIELNNYNGTLGDLIKIIEKVYNVSASYENNTIILSAKSIYMSPIPQDNDSAKDLIKALESLGASNTSYSLSSGLVMYQASSREQENIAKYLKHFYKSFATIKLQAAIITVTLNKTFNTGFDWNSLQAAVGQLSLITPEETINDLTSTIAQKSFGNAANITGNNIEIRHSSTEADIKAVFNLLSQYGSTQAAQSIFLETISGKELELVNIKEVPYTSSINSNISSDTGSTNASGFATEIQEEGLNIKFSPFFNYVKNTVTLSLEMSLTSITGFKQLNAGNGNGTVEHPEIQKQKFNSVVEIQPGSAHLVGGIIYDLVKDNRENLNILDALGMETASKKYTKTKNALFIMLRPTVTIYTTDEMLDKE